MWPRTVTTSSCNQSKDDDPIVITGAGLACALGLNKEEVWNAVIRGQCGIKPLTAIEQPERCDKGGGEAPQIACGSDNNLPREVRYLRSVIAEALKQSRFPSETGSPDRCGIVLGTTLAGMRGAGEYFRRGDLDHLTRFTAASILQLATGDLPLSGFASTTCSACASGLSSIAIAITLLRCGELDLVIAGGYDTLSEYAYAGFNSLRLVTDGSIMPFSKDRQGMKLGEGYGIVVLERLSDASTRRVAPLAQVLGFGESSDSHHLTQPHPQGDGARRAIQAALLDAGLEARQIDMISAHATSTPNNDAAEYLAYRQVFGNCLPQIPVVAFKSHLGHTLGGAGAVELILSMMALQNQCVPPTVNAMAGEIEFDDLRLLSRAMPKQIERTINVSMGFGGANACIVLGRVESRNAAVRAPRTINPSRDAIITGIGIIAPGCIGNEQFVARLNSNDVAHTDLAGGIDEAQIEQLISARRVRRMSEFAKIMLAATTVAIRDAGIDDIDEFAAACNAILGSTHGAIGFSEKYYRQVVEEGIDAANPMLFAEGVPNVGSAQLSLMLKVQGSTQTIVGSRTAGLEAMCIAKMRIESGAWDRAIVGAAEEFHPLINQAYSQCRSPQANSQPMVCSSGAVALVLESRAEVERRSARSRGIVQHSCGGRIARYSPRSMCELLNTLERELGQSDGVFDQHLVERALPEVFSVLPLAKLAAVLLTGSKGMHETIAAHDWNGLASGVAIEVI